MGWIRHMAIIVTGWNEELVEAHEKAKDIFPDNHQVSEKINKLSVPYLGSTVLICRKYRTHI